MARKRLVSPQFFTHGELFDAEASSGLPLRLAYIGLWTACDRRGIFEWAPRVLKLAILPYDAVDFVTVLDALEQSGFITRYVVDGKTFGLIPSFERWQTFHKNEKPSDAPEFTEGCTEPANGRPEPSKVGRSTPVVIAVAGTGTASIAGAGAAEPPAPAAAGADAEPKRLDPVSAFLAAHDFGQFATAVEGLCRSARNADAVIATLKMHLAGELGHERGTPTEIGLAVTHFIANGEEFKARHFGGFVKTAKKALERGERREANAREEQHIRSEERTRAAADAEQADADALLEGFAHDNPERYREIAKQENAAVPTTFVVGREEIVRGRILTAIRREPQGERRSA